MSRIKKKQMINAYLKASVSETRWNANVEVERQEFSGKENLLYRNGGGYINPSILACCLYYWLCFANDVFLACHCIKQLTLLSGRIWQKYKGYSACSWKWHMENAMWYRRLCCNFIFMHYFQHCMSESGSEYYVTAARHIGLEQITLSYQCDWIKKTDETRMLCAQKFISVNIRHSKSSATLFEFHNPYTIA